MRLLPLLALFLVGCPGMLPIDSTEDGFVVAYKTASGLAKSTRELCGAQHPEPCTGVLPTEARNQLKVELGTALDALDAARDEYFTSGDESGLGAVEKLLGAISRTLEVYQ